MANAIKNPSVEAVNHSALYTKKQAAEYLQTTERHINREVALGKLKALKPSPKIFRIRQSDLDAYLEAGATIHA